MNKILRSSLCGRLSLILSLMMILPIVAPMAYGADKVTDAVVISGVPDNYKISIGTGENVGIGAKGVITRDGKDIAKFEVTAVDWGYSRIKVSDLASGETLRIGDAVHITNVGDASKGKSVKKSDGGGKALLALLLVGAVIALSGHKSGGGGSSASSTKNIVVTAKDTSLPADGKSTTTITATVTDGNNAAVADGTLVQFASSIGTISPAQSSTVSGKATAVLTAGTVAGTFTVTATVAGKPATTTMTLTPSTSGNVGSIGLVASPSSIQVLGSGGSQTQSIITATCRDSQGNLVNTGTVTFTSTFGSVIGSAPINASGIATSTFSSSATGQAQITATWLGATATVPVSVTAGPPYAVVVTSTPGSVQADGHSFTMITATVKDIAGNSVTDGTVVSFSVQGDMNGGGNGTITPEGRTANGIATASLFTRNASGTASTPGTATVTAGVYIASQPAGIPIPVADVVNHATQVQFVSQDVAAIHIGSNPTNIRGWDYVNQTSTIGAVVYDSHNNPVPDGTAVYFTTNHGMISGDGELVGNVYLSLTKAGMASATLRSDASGDSSWDGLVTITATSGTVQNNCNVIFSAWPYKPKCQFVMSPTTLKAVQDSSTISVVVLDLNGNPVVDGTAVTIKTNKGSLDSSSTTTKGGVAQVTLSTSADVTSPTALGAGQISISVDSGGHNPDTGNLPVTDTLDFTVVQ